MSTAYRYPESVLEDVHRALEAHGCNPKPLVGTRFTSKCPAHDDSSPSLSVGTGDTGIVIKCFAGCPTDTILNAIGLEYSDLFYETSKAGDIQYVAPPPAAVKQLAGSYVDRAARDALLNDHKLVTQIQHERCISRATLELVGCGKTPDDRIIIPTFDRDGTPAPRNWVALADQRQPGKPKIMGPRGAKPDLWPRPETPRYPDATDVIIVEGEPDALVGLTHHLQVIGLPGVNTWQHTDAHRFARFNHVTVLLDDDETGREASSIIARDLRKAGIRVTERHHTPGAPTRRDLTDLAREHNNLAEAITQLRIVEPDTLYNRALTSVDINKMLDTEPAERQWIWDAYLCRGTLNMLHGAAGLGKSMLGLALAAACTMNAPDTILGHVITPSRVAIIDAENSEDEIHRRIRTAGIQNRNALTYYRTDLTILGKDETRDLFEEIARHSDIVILDSQRGLWDGDEKEQAEAGRMLRDLARIAEATGLCIVIIHHDTKAGQYSGSSDIDAALSGSRLHIQRAHDPKKKPQATDDDDSWLDRILTHGKCRIGPEQRPITFRISIDQKISLDEMSGPTSILEAQCKKIRRWALTPEARERYADKWPQIPVKDIKEAHGLDATDWKEIRDHLRNGIHAERAPQGTNFVTFIDDQNTQLAS